MKLTQRQLRRLIEAEVDKMRTPNGPNSRDEGDGFGSLEEDDIFELADHLREGSRDPYHPDYDEGEATSYTLRVIEQCKDRLASAIDNVEKLLGSDAEVVQELRDIMFDMHDALR